MVRSRKYFPIFICRFVCWFKFVDDDDDDDASVRRQLADVIVDVREWDVDDDGETDVETFGEVEGDKRGGIEDGTDDNGGSLNI